MTPPIGGRLRLLPQRTLWQNPQIHFSGLKAFDTFPMGYFGNMAR
jgi:hypothetical protein